MAEITFSGTLHRAVSENDRVSYFKHIGPHQEGQSLLNYLSSRFTYFQKDQWTDLIQKGDVLLNESKSLPDIILKAGDKVSYQAKTRPEPPVPTLIPVLFEDDDLLIVNKPPHLPVHPTGRYLRNTLIHLLQAQRKTKSIALAHRLDRETSGVCVLTKSQLAKEKVYWLFFNGDIDKTYWALTWGKPHPSSGTIDAPMGPARNSKIRIKQSTDSAEAKTAKTKYHTLSTKLIQDPLWTPPPWPSLEKIKKGNWETPWPVSLVEAKPITGRTNQIRVHLAHLGAGILGDKLYDPDDAVFNEFKDLNQSLEAPKGSFVKLSPSLKRRLVLEAHALHARRLVLRHPRSGKLLEVEAPAPRSWTGLYDPPKRRT